MVLGARSARPCRSTTFHDTHVDDREFGYWRFADEAHASGQSMARLTWLRLYAENARHSAFSQGRAENAKEQSPPVWNWLHVVHEDGRTKLELVSDATKQLWLIDISQPLIV